MSKTVSSDPAVIAEEIVAANGQTASIRSVKNNAGTELFCMDKDGYITKQLLDVTDFASTATYIVYVVGSTYYAKDGATGKVMSSGANAATVLQYALDSLAASGGGILHIKAGTYYLTTGLNIEWHGIHIFGEGVNQSGVGGTVLDYDEAIPGHCFYCGLAAFRLNNISIQNLTIKASGTSQTFAGSDGILMDTVELCRIDGVTVRDFVAGTGISVMCRGGANEYTANVWINNSFLYNNNFGIFADGSSFPLHGVNCLTIMNVVIIGIATSTGIQLGPTVDNSHIIYGDVEGCLYAFINYSTNCTYWGTRSEFVTTHFYHTVECSGCNIYNHHFFGGGVLVSGPGTLHPATKFHDCIGYVTESSGEATMLSGQSSVTVSHGCGMVPRTVLVCGDSSEVKTLWVSVITATEFTIYAPATVTGDRLIKWRAEV